MTNEQTNNSQATAKKTKKTTNNNNKQPTNNQQPTNNNRYRRNEKKSNTTSGALYGWDPTPLCMTCKLMSRSISSSSISSISILEVCVVLVGLLVVVVVDLFSRSRANAVASKPPPKHWHKQRCRFVIVCYYCLLFCYCLLLVAVSPFFWSCLISSFAVDFPSPQLRMYSKHNICEKEKCTFASFEGEWESGTNVFHTTRFS